MVAARAAARAAEARAVGVMGGADRVGATTVAARAVATGAVATAGVATEAVARAVARAAVARVAEAAVPCRVDTVVVMAGGRICHQGPSASPACHRALEQVFDKRIAIHAVSGQWVSLACTP